MQVRYSMPMFGIEGDGGWTLRTPRFYSGVGFSLTADGMVWYLCCDERMKGCWMVRYLELELELELELGASGLLLG